MPQGDGLAVSTITSMEGRTYSRRSLTIDPLVGCNMGASMDLFKQIGFFDEKPCLRTAEDCELSYRVLSAGIKIIYEPEIVIHHISWRDSDAQSKQYNDYATSHGAFYGKYLRRGDMFILLRILIHYARSLKRWFIGIVTFNADRRRNGRAYCMRLIPGIIAGMRAG